MQPEYVATAAHPFAFYTTILAQAVPAKAEQQKSGGELLPVD